MPNISIERTKDVTGLLVTPQNTLTMPHATHTGRGMWNRGARKLPRVAPTTSEGTISPPLNPLPRVMEVKIIFRRKTYQAELVTMPMLISSALAPR